MSDDDPFREIRERHARDLRRVRLWERVTWIVLAIAVVAPVVASYLLVAAQR